jgi:excisionase family DNA binding protein
MKNNDGVQRLLKIPEVASILSVSRAMAYKLVQTGEIRSVHIRSSRRVRAKDLQAYIEFNLQPSEGR